MLSNKYIKNKTIKIWGATRHPSIFTEIFSKISLKAPTFNLPKKRGKPRYFEEFEILLYGRILLILAIAAGAVFLLK
jgi:hypothetical protein